VAFTLILLAFGGMSTRLVMLQIVDADAYAKLASDQRRREITFVARRGTIFDRDGEPLAISVDLQTIWTDPTHVVNPDLEAQKLAPVMGIKAEVLAEKLRGSSPDSQFEYLARQVDPKVARAVKELDLPGIFMEPEAKRFYPNDRLAAHVLGFANLQGIGAEGIEAQYDEILQGEPGRMILEQDPSGNPLPQAEFSYERPEAGRSLFLTLDKEIQYFTELTLTRAMEEYGAKAASAVIMRPDNGEILAMANVPDFDPSNYGDFKPEQIRNRAITDTYEPGSIFKLVTGSGALEDGVVHPKTTFVVPDALPYIDRVFHDSHSHATEEMSFTEILVDSSNVGTIKIGLELGAKRLDHWVREFGFGLPTGLDFPSEEDGLVRPLEDWYGTTIATIPMGQGINVTLLQMAAAYATLANDGVWVEPKLLSATMDSEGETRPASPPARRRVVSRSTAKKMTEIFTQVVKRGTGIEGDVPGYEVAGKTGTAQKVDFETGEYGDEYIASFAGYVPARDPEFVMVVSFDDPALIYGGATAAPVFAEIAEFTLRRLGVPPSGDAEKAAEEIEEAEKWAEPAHD
jgi:cell division protein FtsI (penicillin-binding protein 3)